MRIPVILLTVLLAASCGSSPQCPPCNPTVGYRVIPEVYALMGAIDQQDPGYLLSWLSKAGPTPQLVINSPGGDLEPSLVMAAAIHRRGDIRCLVRGLAASGAFGILQACQHRVMTADSRLMTHEPSWHMDGTYDRYEMLRDQQDLDRTADLWNLLCGKRLKITPAEYTERVKGKAWVMTSAEALAVGAVDEVVP